MLKRYIHLSHFILIASLFFCSGVQADGDCSIDCKIVDGPAPAIIEYLQNVSRVTGIVRAQTSRPVPRNDNYWVTVRGANRDIIGVFSSLFNWNSYYSSFDYYITLPITQNIPPPVKRDIRLLENNINTLTRLLESTVRRGTQYTSISNVCDGLEEYNCTMNGADAKVILTTLIRNSENILNYIRLGIQGKIDEHEGGFILVKNNFQAELDIHYNSFTLEYCGRCQGSFTEVVSTSMTSIADYNRLGKNGMQRWIDAWNLLIGNVSQERYRQIERQVLSRELSRQGLRGDQAEIIMGNLERYNQSGFSLSNNYITNTFNPVARDLNKVYNAFTAALERAYNRYNGNSIPIVELVTIQDEVKTSSALESQILAFYNSQTPFASSEDTASELLLSRLKNYHVSLTEAINRLIIIIPKAENLCDSQGQGIGLCRYR